MIENKKSWRSLSFEGLVQVVAFFTLLFSILSLFGELHRYLELLSHFKIQYLIGSIACALIIFLYKNHKLTIALFLNIILNCIFILPWYFHNSDNIANNSSTDLTILHSNVFRDNKNYDDFLELVKSEDPDLFVMQEVDKNWLIAINDLEKIYTHSYKTPRNDNFGIAIFSKYPFESVKKIKWNKSDVPSIKASILIEEQRVTILAIHPLPPISQEYYQSRNTQINNVAKFSRNHSDPLIVIGDLNTSMWSHDYQPLEHETGLRNTRKGFGLLPTFPAQFLLPLFMIPIDHCLVSSHFVVNDIKVGNHIGSDHLPLIVKLSIKR